MRRRSPVPSKTVSGPPGNLGFIGRNHLDEFACQHVEIRTMNASSARGQAVSARVVGFIDTGAPHPLVVGAARSSASISIQPGESGLRWCQQWCAATTAVGGIAPIEIVATYCSHRGFGHRCPKPRAPRRASAFNSASQNAAVVGLLRART